MNKPYVIDLDMAIDVQHAASVAESMKIPVAYVDVHVRNNGMWFDSCQDQRPMVVSTDASSQSMASSRQSIFVFNSRSKACGVFSSMARAEIAGTLLATWIG
jgi:hypothetical protein